LRKDDLEQQGEDSQKQDSDTAMAENLTWAIENEFMIDLYVKQLEEER
jgi:hypothetical protein